MFAGLSYPHIAPPLDWLMVQLLFYDEIKTVVPSSEIDNLPEEHLRFYDANPGAISFINPESEGLWANTEERNRLIRGFELIKSDSNYNNNELKIHISKKDASTRIGGCSFLHVSKTSPELLTALERLELMPRNTSEIAQRFTSQDNWLVVEEHSADLLMGYLSNNLAKKHGLYPITCKETPFIINSLNDIGAVSVPDSASLLATEILRLEFPYDIATMHIRDYKSIREAYADVRTPFHTLVNNLASIGRLNNISNTNELNDRVRSIASEFDENYRKFRDKESIRKIHKWAPFFVTSILTLTGRADLSFPWLLALTGGSIAIAAIDKVLVGKNTIPNKELFNRLSKLDAQILKKADIQFML